MCVCPCVSAASAGHVDSEHSAGSCSQHTEHHGERLRNQWQPSAAGASSRRLSWCAADTVDGGERGDDWTGDTVGHRLVVCASDVL